jgi:hypothetical protein
MLATHETGIVPPKNGTKPTPCLSSQLKTYLSISRIQGVLSNAADPFSAFVSNVSFIYITEKTGGIWDFKNQPYTGAHPSGISTSGRWAKL